MLCARHQCWSYQTSANPLSWSLMLLILLLVPYSCRNIMIRSTLLYISARNTCLQKEIMHLTIKSYSPSSKHVWNGDVILTAIRLPYILMINHWYILRYSHIQLSTRHAGLKGWMNCHWKSFINLAPSKLSLMLYLVGLNATSCTFPKRMLPRWKSGWCMQLNSLVFAIILMLLWQFCELVDIWHTSSAHIVPQPTLMAVPIHIVPHLVTCVPLVVNRGPQIVMCSGTH